MKWMEARCGGEGRGGHVWQPPVPPGWEREAGVGERWRERCVGGWCGWVGQRAEEREVVMEWEEVVGLAVERERQ